MDKIVVIGTLTKLHPDTREYKQQSMEIEFIQPVAFEVPDTPEYIHSKEETSVTLTLAGVRYMQKQVESLYGGAVASEGTDEWTTEESPSTTGTGVDPKKVEDEWGETVFDETPKSEPANKPDAEVWDEKNEDWE